MKRRSCIINYSILSAIASPIASANHKTQTTEFITEIKNRPAGRRVPKGDRPEWSSTLPRWQNGENEISASLMENQKLIRLPNSIRGSEDDQAIATERLWSEKKFSSLYVTADWLRTDMCDPNDRRFFDRVERCRSSFSWPAFPTTQSNQKGQWLSD